MIIVTVNGQPIPLVYDSEDEDFYAFVKRASDEEMIAIIARAVQLAHNAGCSDADLKRVVNDVTLQIGAIRGDVTVH